MIIVIFSILYYLATIIICYLFVQVVEEMLKLSPDYWSNFLNNLVPLRSQNTPVKRTLSRPLQPVRTPITKNNRIFGSG